MLILIRYQLLILRTQSQFGGLAWYHYDEAFPRDAAARRVVDWSAMHVELYNFHTSIATRTLPDSSPGHTRESSGAQFETTICHSWNAGRCVATRATCQYLHVCDLPRCRGAHRRINCPNQPPSYQFRRLRPLPPSWRSFPHQHPLGLEVVDTVSDVLLCRTCLVSSAVCLFSACVRQLGLRYVCYMYIVIVIFFLPSLKITVVLVLVGVSPGGGCCCTFFL